MVTKTVQVLGVVFLLIGVLGFVPAATPDGNLLGIFAVDAIHNVIHLLSGVLALAFAARGPVMAKTFSKVFGVVYGLVAVIGLLSADSILGIFVANTADDILHVALAAVFLYLGFATAKAVHSTRTDKPSGASA